jgi:hypothetical protein
MSGPPYLLRRVTAFTLFAAWWLGCATRASASLSIELDWFQYYYPPVGVPIPIDI